MLLPRSSPALEYYMPRKDAMGKEYPLTSMEIDSCIECRCDPPPLPNETVICGNKCRIWHQSQKNFCKRCTKHGHRTTAQEICEAYDADSAVGRMGSR